MKTDTTFRCEMEVKTLKEVEITKSDFEDYKEVQESGLTNMFNISAVIDLSNGLTKEKILVIMKNYEELKEKFK